MIDNKLIDAIFKLQTQIAQINTILTSGVEGLTRIQFFVLLQLYIENEMMMTSLADVFEITGAAMTQICDKLESKELICRDHSKIDRRKVIVKLSNQGMNAVNKAFSCFSNEDLKILQQTLSDASQVFSGFMDYWNEK